jgi:hypothetical protein
MATATLRPGEYARHLLLVITPALWPAWPFLPLVRRTPGGSELGVLFDARGAAGLTGYSATVFRTCLFTLPGTVGQLLALPREVYDTAEELLGAGWRAD